eukprot:924923-Pyramimonas_sp.AAC.2
MTVARGQLLFRKGRWYEHVCLVTQGSVSAHLDGRSSPSVGRKRCVRPKRPTGSYSRHVTAEWSFPPCQQIAIEHGAVGEWVGGASFVLGLKRPEAALHPCDVIATEYVEVSKFGVANFGRVAVPHSKVVLEGARRHVSAISPLH